MVMVGVAVGCALIRRACPLTLPKKAPMWGEKIDRSRPCNV